MSSTVGAIYRPQPVARDVIAVRQLSVAISVALLGLLVGLAIMLVVRRLSGALVSPLTGGGLLLAALAIESAIVLCRQLLSGTEYTVLSTRYFPRWSELLPPRAVVLLIVPSITAFTILSSLTMWETPIWGIVLAWLILISTESIPWLRHYRPALISPRWFSALRSVAAPPVESEQPEIPRGLVQQLTRIIEGHRESIHALAKAEIAPNDRFAAVHLSFCPPLTAPPQLSAHAIDADDADVRITLAETFGARLEIRLPDAKPTPRSVMIELLGSAST